MFGDFRKALPLKSALSLCMLTSLITPVPQACLAKKAPQLKKVVVSEKPALDLIELLGHHPELLTPEYLQYVLGRPVKRNVSDASNVVYHWQTNAGGIGTQDCELAESRDANRRIVKACFRLNLPRSTTTLATIEKKINDDNNSYQSNSVNQPATSQPSNGYPPPMPVALTGRKLFDQECRPSLQYSFVPYTKVFYTQAPNTFHVHRAEIDYAGPPLAPPDQNFIAAAATDMRTRALAQQAGDKHHLAVPMLHDHLTENPGDAEAHYALGVSYQKGSQLNEAISEYQLALRYSNGNTDISNKAVQSLQGLHVLQSPDDQLDFHTLRFKQNGQGLTEGDVIATQDRRSMLSGQRPLYTQNNQNSYYPPGGPNMGNGRPSASAGSSNGYNSVNMTSSAANPPVYQQPSFANFQPSANPGSSGQAPSFYGSMQYGSNLFPATASNPNLEPGF